MKKLILGMMLLTGCLYFYNYRDNCVDRHDFDHNRSLSDYSDNNRVDYFDDLKLEAEDNYNKKKLKKKRKIMLNNIFDDFKNKK